jgi:hypothetical protein
MTLPRGAKVRFKKYSTDSDECHPGDFSPMADCRIFCHFSLFWGVYKFFFKIPHPFHFESPKKARVIQPFLLGDNKGPAYLAPD